jgi:oligopeptide transport system permease protein
MTTLNTSFNSPSSEEQNRQRTMNPSVQTPSYFDSAEQVRTALQGLSNDDFTPIARDTIAVGLSRPSLSYWKDAWRRLKKNRQATVSLWIVVGLVLFTLVGPFIWTADPSQQTLGRISEGPSLGKKTILVQADLSEWKPLLAEGVPAAPETPVPAMDLGAPQNFKLMSDPSTVAVRLSWDAVPGATGYKVYRGPYEPEAGSLGLPIATLESGNAISAQDAFELKPGTMHYAVVALRDMEESPRFAKIAVQIPEAISLTAALKLDPKAEAGKVLELPLRPLGSDYLGRDLLARLMSGARVSLFIGFVAPFLSLLLGVMVGGISGYFGGKTDAWIMRFTDFVLALPFLLFMILFKVVFGAEAGENGIGPMLLAMVALSWTGPARLTRGQILQLRESEFVQASRLLGAKPLYLIVRHLLPNTLGVILVSLTFAIPSAIFTEAFLSFIGMGVVPPTPSWGSMCNDGIQTFLTHPHEFIFPAILISITVLAFNLLGDGLRDALDPKMRSVS